MTTRIYTVTQLGGATRLVKATSQTQALRYVVQKTLSVDHASQDDLVRLLHEGIKVEAVNAEDGPADNPSN